MVSMTLALFTVLSSRQAIVAGAGGVRSEECANRQASGPEFALGRTVAIDVALPVCAAQSIRLICEKIVIR